MAHRLRMLACVGLAVVLGVAVYGGLVEAGLVPDPAAPVVSGDLALARSGRPGLRVLFVGNSFTAANAMPALLHRLAAADEGAAPVFAVAYTAGGWTLQRASRDSKLAALLVDVRWDAVVLQEQSRIPSLGAEQRRRLTDRYARALHAQIAQRGARTILFETWGYDGGDLRNVPDDTFVSMQARLDAGYSELAAQLPAAVAPVGAAWAEALRRKPGVELWARDGKHPSEAGSFLAACVFYAVLTRRDPGRSTFGAGLDRGEARFLEQVARDVAAN